MKKPLRLIAALLAVCVLSATVPPVGLAAGTYDDLRDYVTNAPDGIADLGGATVLLNDTGGEGSSDAPYLIDKPVTIQNGTVTVWAGGIVLGADVTFSNVDFQFASTASNFIAANGHTLTLNNVQCGGGTNSCDLFGGTMTGIYSSFTIAPPGPAGSIVINGNTSLQGRGGVGNIYAGNLLRSSDGTGGTPEFSGSVRISINDKADSGALGTIYASGATKNGPNAAANDSYTVSGGVTISSVSFPDMVGTGSTTNVIYRGDGNQDTAAFTDITSLTVESGNLAPTANSSLRNNGTLTLNSGAKLDLQQTDGFTLNVCNFVGNGGFVFLGKDQNWQIQGQVTGTAKVAIGDTTSDLAHSQTLPVAGHPYITAPNSRDGNFVLLPYSTQPDMTLERDSNGSWTATQPVQEASKLISLHPPANTPVPSGTAEAIIPLNPACTAGTEPPWESLPFSIRVNRQEATFDSDNACYMVGGLAISVGDFGTGDGVVLSVGHEDLTYETPIPDAAYAIQITVSGGEHTESGNAVTASCTLTVGDGAPAVTTIPVPTANTGLKWTGQELTGVNGGTGYTLSGDYKAAAVGTYTATATLENNYRWADGTTEPKTISWSISKADGPAAPTGLTAAAPSTAGGSDGKITGTTAAMEYASSPDFTSAQTCGSPETTGLAAGTYYVRVKATATHEAGASASITVPVPGAPTVTGISVNSTTHKTEYKTGDSLDVTNLTIEAVYSNGGKQTVPVTAAMVSGFNSSSAAENQILTISYEGQTTTYTVKITGSQQPGGTKRQVTVGNTGDGGTAAGTYEYEEGVNVAIRAGSKSGLTFAAWDVTGVTLANRNVPDVSFTMPSNDVTLNAIWTPNGTPSGHTHAWDPAWKSSATHHWHDCAASGCPITSNAQKSGYAAHTAGDWVVDRPAGSTQSGVRHRSCTVCGFEMVRETIPATDGGSSSGGGSSSDSDSSSGGSSSSGGNSGSTSSVKNPDGSTTSTSTNKTTGTVTETTRRPDGSKTVVETKKDGTVTTTDTAKDGSTIKTVARPNGTTETTVKQAGGLTATIQENQHSAKATVRIPAKVTEANPGGVVLPIPALSGENASITVHTGVARPVPVEIPVYGNEATTVACLVNSDGSETILKTALLAGGHITVSVSNGATVRVRDNGKNFQDVHGHWAKSAIDFVTARELFSGRTSGTFAPDAFMSRAMLATVLARLDGVDAAGGPAYQKGMSWAVAQGISDGRNPDGQVTREQFVTMLYRCAGSPAATNRELHFSDAEKINAYAREAIRWATENGILSGYKDGSFVPQGKTTRAQAAAMLARYVEFLNQQ